MSTKLIPKFLILPGCVFLTACWDYAFDLGSGYKFVRTNASSHLITSSTQQHDDGTVLIEADIKQIAYNGSIIVGYREHQTLPTPELEKKYHQNSGYFVIDKQSGFFKVGMDQLALDEFLRAKEQQLLEDELDDVRDWLYCWK